MSSSGSVDKNFGWLENVCRVYSRRVNDDREIIVVARANVSVFDNSVNAFPDGFHFKIFWSMRNDWVVLEAR